MAGVQGLILAFLYLFIYILLQLEDYALFIGSVFLFAILATVMYVSRKVDWYRVGG
jgi:inner membrane protein